jgi:hypothetical protein
LLFSWDIWTYCAFSIWCYEYLVFSCYFLSIIRITNSSFGGLVADTVAPKKQCAKICLLKHELQTIIFIVSDYNDNKGTNSFTLQYYPLTFPLPICRCLVSLIKITWRFEEVTLKCCDIISFLTFKVYMDWYSDLLNPTGTFCIVH